jgi:lariat debranching enzyme
MPKIAVQGCCHGALDKIYEELEYLNEDIQLLIIAGDFQAIRNEHDLDQMAVPQKFKHLGNFYEYYTGKKVAPVLTIFIGGNHEASNYLHELYYGGWVCPNIYYLGSAGVVNVAGLRIGGISGIYNASHYDKGFFETIPLSGGDVRSIYHIRKFTVNKIMQLKSPLDIFLSHDWPRGIVKFGDKEKLLQIKRFLRNEVIKLFIQVDKNTLGNPPAETLLKELRPRYWFSAHMHVKFEAIVNHQVEKMKNPDEIEISDSDSDSGSEPESKRRKVVGCMESVKNNNNLTKFLALDKCLPGRKHLEVEFY